MTYLATGAERRVKALDQALRFYERGGAGYGDVLIAARAFNDWLESGTVPERTKGATGGDVTVTSPKLSEGAEARIREALESVGLKPRDLL